MFERVLIPNENNATITLPADLYGLEVKIMAFPVEKNKRKYFPWLSGKSGIDNPVKIGKVFRKYSR
jgi:hypothetical protein